MEIRTLEETDIAAAEELVTIARWNQSAEDWVRYAAMPGSEAFGMFENDNLAATIAVACYRKQIGWIGMLIVNPEYRRRGIGTKLMSHAMAALEQCGIIGLDATPMGKPVYERLGFVYRSELHRYVLPRAAYSTAARACAETSEIDTSSSVLIKKVGEKNTDVFDGAGIEEEIDSIQALDFEAFGADRSALMKSLLGDLPDCAFRSVVDPEERATNESEPIGATGFVLGRYGRSYAHIGPLVSYDEAVAAKLLEAAVARAVELPKPAGVTVDVFEDGHTLVEKLKRLGFEYHRKFLRMTLKNAPHPNPGRTVDGLIEERLDQSPVSYSASSSARSDDTSGASSTSSAASNGARIPAYRFAVGPEFG